MAFTPLASVPRSAGPTPGFTPLGQTPTAAPQQGAFGGIPKASFGGTPAPSTSPNALVGYGKSALGTAIGGVNHAIEGANEAQPAGSLSPGSLVEGVGKILGGAATAVTSPIAPLLKPLGDAVTTAGNALSNTPYMQAYGRDTASLPADQPTAPERIASSIADYSNAAGLIAGGTPAGRVAIGNAADTAVGNTLGKVDARYGGVTPPPPEVPGATTGASTALMNKVARINPSDAKNFSQMSGGKTPGEFLDARGIYGNPEKVTSQLFDRFTQSKNAVDDALSKLPGLYKNQAVETALQDVVEQAKATSAPGVPSPYLTQAETLLGKAQNEGLSMSDINAAKRLYESTVKTNYIKDGVSAGIERANNIDSTIRTWQQDTADKLGFTNIKTLNKETQLSRMLIDAMGKKANAQIGNNLVGLTDWIVASGIPHDPASLALLIGKKFFGSGTGQGALASVLSKGKKLPQPSADIGAMNTNPATPQLPGAGQTSSASNLPPVVHAGTSKLLPSDRQGTIFKTTDTTGGKGQLNQYPSTPPITNKNTINNIPETLPKGGNPSSRGPLNRGFVKLPGIGPKLPEPASVVKNMDAEDIKTVRQYTDLLDGKIRAGGSGDVDATMKMETLLDNMGLSKKFATQKAKDQYIVALKDAAGLQQ